jgi:GT2 family glycosyltransferase
MPTNLIKGRVSIIIPCWNGEKWIEKCFSSIRGQTYKDLELIVIDNGSMDRSIAVMQDSFQDLKPMIIENPSNYGFAKAMNQGIDAAKGEFIFALNLDVVLEPDYIEKLVGAFDDPKIGSATGKLYRFPEMFGGKKIIDTTGHVFLAERSVLNRGMLQEDHGQFDDQKQIFGVCAAAAMYRREMLEGVKMGKEYFDEDYFAYYEDVDLDWRAINAGWKSVFVPEAVGFHAKRAFAKKLDKEMRIISNRNKYLTIVKNDSLINYMIDLPVIAAHDLDYLFYSHFRDYRLFFRNLLKKFLSTPLALRKRSKLKNKRIITAREFRKYIVYDRKDRIKARDLIASIIGVVILSFFIKFRYLLICFIIVFFVINPAVYYMNRLFKK